MSFLFSRLVGAAASSAPVTDITSFNHPDLLGAWRMNTTDYSAPTMDDVSLNGNDGTVTNGTLVTGIQSQGLSFDRNSAEGSMTSAATVGNGSGGFSVCMWLKFDGTSGLTGNGGISSQWRSGQRSWLFAQTDTGSITRIELSSDGASAVNTVQFGAASFSVGVYAFYILEFVPSTSIKLYKNLVDIPPSSTSGTTPATVFNSTAPFEIGSYFGDATNRGWRGDYDKVRIFNRVLTPTEKSELYNGGSGI